MAQVTPLPVPHDAPPASRLLRIEPTRAVWEIAWPVIVFGLLRASYFLADSYWAGRMGDDAPAALSAMGGAAFATWILMCLGELPATGTHALVARAAGAGDTSGVSRVFFAGALVATLLGVATAIFARPLAALYFDLVGFRGPAFARPLSMGLGLLESLGWGAAALNLHAVTGAVFRGLGDTRTPTLISAVTLVLNAALAPVLMFGLGPSPALGLAGAGWATVLANVVGVAWSLWALAREGHLPRPSRASLDAVRPVFAIGAPQALSGVGFCLVYVVLGELLTTFGPSALAGVGLGHRIEGPAYQIAAGFGAAAATLVGQHAGARDPAGARRAANVAARLACWAMVPLALPFVVAPHTLVGLWTSDAETIARGAGYLLAIGTALVPMALEVVYEGAFGGAGRTMPAMAVVLPLTAARIPAAILLSRTSLGIHGVWIAIAASTALKGALLWALFARDASTQTRDA